MVQIHVYDVLEDLGKLRFLIIKKDYNNNNKTGKLTVHF